MEGGGWETEVFGTKGNLQGTVVPGKTSEHQYNPANIYAWGKKKKKTPHNKTNNFIMPQRWANSDPL